MIELAGHWVVWAAAVATALGVLWRFIVRPVWRRIRAMSNIITRELTPNGGQSMKDTLGTIHDDLADLNNAHSEDLHLITGRLDDHEVRIKRLEYPRPAGR